MAKSRNKSPRKNGKKSAGGGRDNKGGTGSKNVNKNQDGDAGKKSSSQLQRSSPPSAPTNYEIPAAMMCFPAAADQQQRASTNDSSDMAMMDRLMAVQQAGLQQASMQQVGGAGGFGGNQQGSGGGGSALANYAGTAADSFAQSFVDRWAGKMGGVSGGDMPSTSQYSPMRGGNPMLSSWQQQQQMHQQGGSSESDYRMMAMMMEQQQVGWRVCAYCQNGAFMSLVDLQSHEANCPLRGGGAGLGMGMMSSYGHNMMNSMQQQQMNPAFLGCLPIGTSIPSVATTMAAGGMNSDGLQLGAGRGGGEMTASSLPAFSMPSYADIEAKSNPAPSKQRSMLNRSPPIRKEDDPEVIENSKGPFKTLDKPILLALDGDEYWLTPLHCFVRKNCVEAFTATPDDAQKTPTKGKRRNVTEGQLGIRCPHCNKKGKNGSGSTTLDKGENDAAEKVDTPSRGSVYYPNSITNVYNATMNLLQRHLFFCPNMPPEILKKYSILKKDDARSGTSKMYWIESAKSLGFVDTLTGIRLSTKTPPPPPSVQVAESHGEAARKRTSHLLSVDEEENGDAKDDETELSGKDVDDEASPLVLPEDAKFTKFSFILMSQMRRCTFTEADRLGKRKGLSNGFAGLACRHCFGGFGAGRFFPSSIKTLSDTSKTLDVILSHLERCREIPKSVVDDLMKAKKTHEIERGNCRFGSQKAFFTRIWKRLHKDRADALEAKPPRKAKKKQKTSLSEPSINSDNSDELKRFRDNITRITGNMHGDMHGGNMMNSMMMGGFVNPAILNAMGGGGTGGNQPMLAMQQRFPQGNDGRTSDEDDQPSLTQV